MVENCTQSAKTAIADVDLRLLMHDAYGKGFMKKCRVSPDAYIQMALQLAYYRVSCRFFFLFVHYVACVTYIIFSSEVLKY